MSKFVEVGVSIYKTILVEVQDFSDESYQLAYDIACESIDDDIGDSEIVANYDGWPPGSYDEVILLKEGE